MKSFIALLLFLIFTISSFCQKTEFSLNVYSGLFSYKGNGSAGTSKINYGIDVPSPYTSNVYGSRPGFPISFEGQVIRATKANVLFGLGLSYDLLESNIKINKVEFSPEVVQINVSYLYDAEGNTKLKNSYFNINPFVGQRFLKNKITLDLLGGFDLGLCLTSIEKGSAITVTSKQVVSTNIRRAYPPVDFRPRIQFKTGYKRTGIMLGYSLGLTNYQSPASSKAYSGFLRIGISYSIK